MRDWLAVARLSMAQIRKTLQYLPEVSSFSEIAIKLDFAIDWRKVDADLTWLEKNPGYGVVTLSDAAYPERLREIAVPPPVLFIKGNVQALSLPQLAVVGSRNPTPWGCEITQSFVRDLVAAGLAITSGLAYGIDAIAHRETIKRGGVTLAVVGNSLDWIYPKLHARLVEEIAEKGVAISEFCPETPPHPMHFPRRNRIVSGLSVGTLVTEASLRSGSLITANLANEQGREVFAVPGSIHNALSKGCHQLIQQGAKLVQNAAEILEELAGFPPQQAQKIEKKVKTEFALDQNYHKLLKCMGFEVTSVDSLLERSGLKIAELSSLLPRMELQGDIVAVSGGYIKIKV